MPRVRQAIDATARHLPLRDRFENLVGLAKWSTQKGQYVTAENESQVQRRSGDDLRSSSARAAARPEAASVRKIKMIKVSVIECRLMYGHT